MLLSLNWLKDFVDIPKKVSAEELGLLLTKHTVEIEGVKKEGDKFKNVVVGKILEIKKHPNADRLRIATVETGHAPSLQIVCGAPNIEVGQKVPVALVGAVLPASPAGGPNGLEIKEAEVRGEKSFGMMCAPDELGLGDSHDGIMVLDKKAKVGEEFAKYLGLKDVIFEVDNKSITHRPDLWSHYGMAREVAAFLGSKFKEYNADIKILNANTTKKSPQPLPTGQAGPFTKGGLKVKVEDFDLCPRYMAVAMDGVKIEKSPKWIEERLIAAGVRPINNIVDITNYVLLELGQPLHAFGMEQMSAKKSPQPPFIKGGNIEIVVRRAKNKEIIETLDGEKRELDKNDIVITDGKKPVALGGVMGGANSEINDGTESIIIESANFNPIAIRKTSTKLGFRTESSARFEKGLDPNLSETALIRAVELVKKLCPKAKVISNLIDEKKFELNQCPVELDLDWLAKKIGEDLGEKKVVGILENLGFSAGTRRGAFLQITVPTWRATGDISIPEDLAEEVARIYGYDNIKPAMPRVEMAAPEVNEEKAFERKIKNILANGAALAEVKNYSFVGEEQLKKLGIDFSEHIRLANPLADNQTMLRQSLVANLVNNVRINQAKYDEIKIFEIGSVYFSAPGNLPKGGESKETLPHQEKRLAIAVAGEGDNVFSKAKGTVEYLLSAFGLTVQYEKCVNNPAWAEKNVCAEIKAGGKNIGKIAMLSAQAAQKSGLKKSAGFAEIGLDELFNLVKTAGIKKYKKLEKYPPATRDLAFVLPAEILYNDIKKEIVNFNELIKEAELFDVYEGGKLGAGKKSMAFHIAYQADRTLTAEEVDEVQGKLVKILEKKFGAKVRDF